MAQEALALRTFSGYGTVRLLEEAPGLLLLERVLPGISLTSYFPFHEEESVFIVCELIKRLYQAPLPSSGVFPSVEDWLKILDENNDIPFQYLGKACSLKNELLATMASPCLLHGDLHHDNILQGRARWMAIDPKGVMGEPAYEAATFIRNPLKELIDHSNVDSIIQQRIKHFSQALPVKEKRLKEWCFVQSVLAWAWALEDERKEKYFEKSAHFFYSIF
jgi:streptomycin 6-kinase